METTTSNNVKKGITVFIFGLIFVAVSAVIYSKISNKISPQSGVGNREPVVCSSDFSAYTQLIQNSEHDVKLIPVRKSMYVEDGQFKNSQVIITKNETATSKVACGYLFVRAGTTDAGAVKSWEDVVIDPNGFGGHLNPLSAISVNDGDKYSEYLYALNKIQYWPTHNRQSINMADWAALLNVSETVPFTIAFNSENPTGFVDEVSIAYKCWDPETGKENNGCKLVVSQPIDQTSPLE
jgi:hypothetical protein